MKSYIIAAVLAATAAVTFASTEAEARRGGHGHHFHHRHHFHRHLFVSYAPYVYQPSCGWVYTRRGKVWRCWE
jgi:hypothetical protein